MKGVGNGYVSKSKNVIKISAFMFISVVCFYLGKNWSDGYQQLIFFNSRQNPTITSSSSVTISPNFNKKFDISSLINDNNDTVPVQQEKQSSDAAEKPADDPPSGAQKTGMVDENGVMRDDFEVGEFDPEVVDNWGEGNETDVEDSGSGGGVKLKKFGLCPMSMKDYIPCLDNEEAIRKLSSTDKGEKFERHCPEKGTGLNCLVPAPKGYRTRIPWPKSRDEVWFSNVPHARLAEDKGGQNWITVDKDKFKFPGGGTQFIHGADQYLDQIEKITFSMKKSDSFLSFLHHWIAAGVHLVVTLELLWMSDVVSLVLEHIYCPVIPPFAFVPSTSLCSLTSVSILVNRILRAGGYFVWAAQPVYKHEPLLEQQWEEMINLTSSLCWRLVKKEGYIAIWQKPMNNSCYLSRAEGATPPLCDSDDDPDDNKAKVEFVQKVDDASHSTISQYVNLKACIARLPEDGIGANVNTWPARLQMPPDRLQSIQIDSYTSRKYLFTAESKYWNEIIQSYVRALHWKQIPLRNVLDMHAGFGGFAAALSENKLDCWVLNVVPISGPNTLPVIYDRGLLGVMHDWCEPFDTYPRTYDLLHAANLFSVEQKRCNMSTIMLEMDRILRPGGRVYIRDTLAVMGELQEIAKAMGWHITLRDTSEGPQASYRVLTCDKRLLHA
ncbi:hypothetical protein Leryth_015089 [Lithospermum erythrorhizon]|nr:hypothetical protein Leryth_015089 [Lithospermum erythrorhizon]